MSRPKFKMFLCEYPYQGARWCLHIKALDHADAEARLKALPWAEVCGEVMFSASVPRTSWFARLFKRHEETQP